MAQLRPLDDAERSAISAALAERSRIIGGRRERERFLDDALDDILRDSEATLESVLMCPGCGRDASHRSFESRSHDTFWVSCAHCDQEWGLRRCAACSARYPILYSRGGRRSGGTLDEVLGSVAAASPCAADLASDTFICTSCGACAGDSLGCTRCQRDM